MFLDRKNLQHGTFQRAESQNVVLHPWIRVRVCARVQACVVQTLVSSPFHSCGCLLMEVRPPKHSRDPFTVFYYALGPWHRRTLLYKYSWASMGCSADISKALNNPISSCAPQITDSHCAEVCHLSRKKMKAKCSDVAVVKWRWNS